MSIRRRAAASLAAAAAVFMAVGCGQPAARPAPRAAGRTLKVGLVLDTGGVDDKSFNAAAYAGLQRAEKELGVEGRYVESREPADYKTNLSQFASEGYDVVFAVGYKMAAALDEVATDFPDTKFVIVDGGAPASPNCAALQFTEEQGTFLAGFIGASVSRTHTLGFIGGEDIPLIRKFEAGYRAGAMCAATPAKVVAAYTGDWNDINKARGQADQEFANGADIIFQAAGKAGLGVIEAARVKGKGYYAIGVDMDQDGVAPGTVLVSELKRLDTAVFDMVKRVRDGQFQPGARTYDLKSGGVGVSDMKYTSNLLPDAAKKRLAVLRSDIEAGRLVVPKTIDALASFTPPKG